MGRILRLQLTDLPGNANKEYVMVELPNGHSFEARYGRVGGTLQTKIYPMSQWDSVYRTRLRHGYFEVGLHDTAKAAVFLPGPVGDFVAMLLREANESIASYSAKPVDQLSLNQIATARDVLREYRDNPRVDLIGRYYNLIPTQLPRRIDTDEIIAAFNADVMENRLDQLEAAVIGLSNASGSLEKLIGCEIRVSEHRDQVIASIQKTLVTPYTIKEVYDVVIRQERDAYEACPVAGATVLYHGTRTANGRHIIRSGLQIRQAINGSRFGRGIYFADQAERSMNYTSGYSGSRILFICSVRLGNKKVLTTENYDLKAAPKGYDSVHGTHAYSGMDEFIVYHPEQVTIRAIAEVVR